MLFIKVSSRRELSLKSDPSQKSDLKTDLKIKIYNAIFYTRSIANEFTKKFLENFTKLYVFTHKKKKNFFKIIKMFFIKVNFFTKL